MQRFYVDRIDIMHTVHEVMSPGVSWVHGLGKRDCSTAISGFINALSDVFVLTFCNCFERLLALCSLIVFAKMAKYHGFELNFYRVHLLYFLLTTILSSIIMYGSGINSNSGNAEASFKLRYIDAIFLCASAMTNAGLNTVNQNSLTGFQQSILYVLILIGNVTVTTKAMIWIRRHFLRNHMKELLQHSKSARQIVDEIESEESGKIASLANGAIHSVSSGVKRVTQTSGMQNLHTDTTRTRTRHHEMGLGGIPYPWEWEVSRKVGSKLITPTKSIQERLHHYLSFQPSFDQKERPQSTVDLLEIDLIDNISNLSVIETPRSLVVSSTKP